MRPILGRERLRLGISLARLGKPGAVTVRIKGEGGARLRDWRDGAARVWLGAVQNWKVKNWFHAPNEA